MKELILYLFFYFIIFNVNGQGNTSFVIQKGERWYGAVVSEGINMPFEAGYEINLNGNTKGNQAAPLILSNKGNLIWSESPFRFAITQNKILITDCQSNVYFLNAGKTLRDAYLLASRNYFPPQGSIPDSLLFTSPQYNTWIELGYNQNQSDILKYAHDIIDNGFQPGVIMIDDNWAPYYGRFEFRKDRFSDAKSMVDELHHLGFKVMLWVCPFIGADTEEGRDLIARKLVLMSKDGNADMTWEASKNPTLVKWWNGYSLVLDFSNPEAVVWCQDQLDKMVRNYGLDGFKFDAGDAEFYEGDVVSFGNISSNEQSRLWGEFGLKYPLNEYRAMWKGGGLPLVERLRDKLHTWEDLGKLIPDITIAGMSGYSFVCPDMIGGGEIASFQPGAKLDQNLIVRSAQCHALMPMMQFSVAPWRVLDEEHLNAVKQAVELRQKFVPYILKLAKKSTLTGEPMVTNMEYAFPEQGMEECKDQFMLGDSIMVAPVISREDARFVKFPSGEWIESGGKTIKGPAIRHYNVPIDSLLWFRRIQ